MSMAAAQVRRVDALQIINALGRNTAVSGARLPNDTAPSGSTNFDLITRSPTIELTVSVAETDEPVSVRIAGAIEGSFQDVTDRFTDNRATLSTEDIDAIFGQTLPDGDHRIDLRLGDDSETIRFTLTVDRVAPTVSLPGGDVLRDVGDTLRLQSNEPLELDLIESSARLTSPDSPTVTPRAVELKQADTLATLQFERPIADADYTLEVTPFDVAGNLGESQFSFSVVDPPGITQVSPSDGENQINVSRETIIRFDEPVLPETVTSDAFQVLVSGTPVPAPSVFLGREQQPPIFTTSRFRHRPRFRF